MLFRSGAIFVIELGLREDRVEIGEVLNKAFGEDAEVAHRHALVRVGPAGGVGEGGRELDRAVFERKTLMPV